MNAAWNGSYPIVCAPCETREPEALKRPLDHGANPNCTKPGRKYPDSALDFVIGTFSRSEQLAASVEILHEARCESRRNMPSVLDLLRGRLDLIGARLDEDPSLVDQCEKGADLSLRAKLSGWRAGRTVNEEARSGNQTRMGGNDAPGIFRRERPDSSEAKIAIRGIAVIRARQLHAHGNDCHIADKANMLL